MAYLQHVCTILLVKIFVLVIFGNKTKNIRYMQLMMLEKRKYTRFYHFQFLKIMKL